MINYQNYLINKIKYKFINYYLEYLIIFIKKFYIFLLGIY